jgi:DNA-binding winged helix-turn-helix (wHTH) protein
MVDNGQLIDPGPTRRVFRFGTFQLDARSRQLTQNGYPAKLTAKTFDVLLYLVERSGQVVSRDEMLEKIWSDHIVEDGNLSVHISTLRKLLGDTQSRAGFIATVPGTGYSFVANVQEQNAHSANFVLQSPLSNEPLGSNGIPERLQTNSSEAYRAYVKGRRSLRQLTRRSINRALRYFEKAIAIDPAFALAHVRIGLSYYYLNAYQQVDYERALKEIERSIDRAFELDPDLSEAHTLRAIYKQIYEWDWTSAEPDFRRGVELNPGSVFARCAYANALKICGRFDDARRELEATLEFDDPLALSVNTIIGSLLFVERRYEECMVHLREMLEFHPASFLPHLLMALCLQQIGDIDTALAKMRKAQKLDPTLETSAYLGETLARAGQTDEALQILNRIEASSEPQPFQTFYLYLALGETDRAFDFLERSLRRREIGQLAIYIDPRSDQVRDDPRFRSTLDRMNFPI